MLLAVNGTLMRGFGLNQNMIDAAARFVREARTAPAYRMYSIGGRYPGMVRTTAGGGRVELELWDVDAQGLVQILVQEPPGLTVGKVLLDDGSQALGVLAEPWLTEGQEEITRFGGWRKYIVA